MTFGLSGDEHYSGAMNPDNTTADIEIPIQALIRARAWIDPIPKNTPWSGYVVLRIVEAILDGKIKSSETVRSYEELTSLLGFVGADAQVPTIPAKIDPERLHNTLEELLAADLEVFKDVEAWGRAFEMLQTSIQREALGAYFTPKGLARELVSDSLRDWLGINSPCFDSDFYVLDPAVGGGILLIAYAELISELRMQYLGEAASTARKQVVRCLHGLDKNPYSPRIAMMALSRWAGTSVPSQHFRVQDSILGSGKPDNWTYLGRIDPALRVAWRKLQKNPQDDGLYNRILRALDHISEKISNPNPNIRSIQDDVNAILHRDAQGLHWTLPGEHWVRAFPHVFRRPLERSGFDLILSNPPYLGSSKLRPLMDERTRQFHDNTLGCGSSDLLVYFIRRSYEHLRPGGRLGLLTAVSVTYPNNHSHGLQPIVNTGGTIFFRNDSSEWTREAAVHVVCFGIEAPSDTETQLEPSSAGLSVPYINSKLEVAPEMTKSYTPPLDRALTLIIPQGSQVASAILSAEEWAKLPAQEREVCAPLLDGQDALQTRFGSATRYTPWPFREQAPNALHRLNGQEFLDVNPSIAKILRDRLSKPGVPANPTTVRELVDSLRAYGRDSSLSLMRLDRVLSVSIVTNHFTIFWVHPNQFILRMLLMNTNRSEMLTVMQSRSSEAMIRTLSATQGSALRISNTSIQNLPLPITTLDTSTLGDQLVEVRKTLQDRWDLGLTKLYTRSKSERGTTFKSLVDIHDAIDRHVLHLYGWGDLIGMLPSYWQNEKTPEFERFRVAVSTRLVALNRELASVP